MRFVDAGAGWGLRVGVIASLIEHERRNWVLWHPVLFAVGSAIYFSLATEPSVLTALFIWVGALALLVASRLALPASMLASVICAGALLAASGFLAAKVRTEWVRAPVVSEDLGKVEAIGVIELIEPRARGGQRMTLALSGLGDLAADALPRRVRVNVRKGLDGFVPGDVVRVMVKLSPPPEPVAPGDYDFARASWFKQLGGVGFAIGPVERIDDGPTALTLTQEVFAGIARWRKTIGDRVTFVLPGETGAIANALITGERGAISEETNEAYRASGLYHILSISGLHMAIMGGAIFFAVRLLLATAPSVALRYPIKKWAAVAAIIGSLGYLAISGAAFATVRSFIMITIMFAAILADRPAVALRNVALAALIILVLFPESALDPGFQMSFAAVVALVAGFEAIRPMVRPPPGDGFFAGFLLRALLVLGGIVASTILASLAVAPFALYHFNQSQHYAVLANVLAMPACNLIVMPGALATLVAIPFGLEKFPLWVMGWGIDLMTWVAVRVGELPGSVGRHASPPEIAFLSFVAGGLVLALVSHRVRWLGLIAMVAGAVLSQFGSMPDVLIGRDGDVVAVRGRDGGLHVSPAERADYTISRWLERDGDVRTVDQAKSSGVWTCDGLGCAVQTDRLRVAVPKHAAAVAEDCNLADIVILRLATTARCDGPALALRKPALDAGGAHAIYVEHSTDDRTSGSQGRNTPQRTREFRVDTVAGFRGSRPWAQPGQ